MTTGSHRAPSPWSLTALIERLDRVKAAWIAYNDRLAAEAAARRSDG